MKHANEATHERERESVVIRISMDTQSEILWSVHYYLHRRFMLKYRHINRQSWIWRLFWTRWFVQFSFLFCSFLMNCTSVMTCFQLFVRWQKYFDASHGFLYLELLRQSIWLISLESSTFALKTIRKFRGIAGNNGYPGAQSYRRTGRKSKWFPAVSCCMASLELGIFGIHIANVSIQQGSRYQLVWRVRRTRRRRNYVWDFANIFSLLPLALKFGREIFERNR